MDWTGLSSSHHTHDQEQEDDDEFDFYSDSITTSNAEQSQHNGSNTPGPLQTPKSTSNVRPAQPNTITSSKVVDERTVEEKKAEALKKANLLRAKLIAQRQKTPLKSSGVQPGNTPIRATPSSIASETNTSKSARGTKRKELRGSGNEIASKLEQNNDALGLDSLLAEGRAAAEARNVRTPTQTTSSIQPQAMTTSNNTNGAAMPNLPITTNTEATTARSSALGLQNAAPTRSAPKNLNDGYYADLATWLEMTGYHDIEYRNAKIQVHKQRYQERKALEDEVARIQQRIAEIEELEKAEMQTLRSQPSRSTPAAVTSARPPLPATLGDDKNAASAARVIVKNESTDSIANSAKRQRSPETDALAGAKRRREDELTTNQLVTYQPNAGTTNRNNNHPAPRRRSRSPRRAFSPEPRESRYRDSYYANRYGDYDNRDTGYRNGG